LVDSDVPKYVDMRTFQVLKTWKVRLIEGYANRIKNHEDHEEQITKLRDLRGTDYRI